MNPPRHHFPAELNQLSSWLYFRSPLSLHMVEEMLTAYAIPSKIAPNSFGLCSNLSKGWHRLFRTACLIATMRNPQPCRLLAVTDSPGARSCEGLVPA
jgi:hypothetical protein